MSTATLLKYTVLYLETRRDAALCDVHATGCSDLDRASNRHAVRVDEELDLDNLEKYMDVLDADELGYETSDVKVHGCAWDAHKAAKASTGKRTPRGSKAKPVVAPAADAVKNVKLKRGTRVHTPGTNGLPMCRATGTADKYEATHKEVSCTACVKATTPVATETPATRPQRTKAGGVRAVTATPRRVVRDLDASDVEAEARVAAQTPAKPRTRSRRATTPDATPQPASSARRARRSAAVVESSAAMVASAVKNGRAARRNGKAQDEANAKAEAIIAETTAAVQQASATGIPPVNPKCTAEQADLAIKVRALRATGAAWWRIAHELGLPGSGPSVKQGKTGAAHARRAWERAWGKTYSDTSVPRETKAIKKERALTHEARPFFSSEIPDEEILDATNGKTITWFTRVGTTGGAVVSEQVAEVTSGSAKIVRGPKGRVLEFHERIYEQTTGGSGVKTPMVGPYRSVYIDRIEKVGA